MASEQNKAHDPVAVVKAFDGACNAGDIERAMAFFADDAVVITSLALAIVGLKP